ncbi:hypothetical protein LQ567_09320 [Niabella pedocola]|uniref:Uncharacterized protein n=1 Tax=Niabella pedocola TaxID=1752077 RepID=A0ABS8PPD8_9BACT|nr:hypothetical protein [Niabella pedocola]MCD2422960.1 hypothetical protein [Niabella pedocola]
MSGIININEPFSEKYTLIIETDMRAVNIAAYSRARIRWDFRVLRVAPEELEVELIRLDNVLLEATNPLTKEVQQVSDVFGRMYNELHLVLDRHGQVLRILNLDIILDKWATVKEEMQQHIEHTPEIKDVILLNDELFQSQEKVITAIQHNEFFMLYFNHLYGNYFPFRAKREQQYNFFNTAMLQMQFGGHLVSEGSHTVQLEISGTPLFGLGGFTRKAYAQFADQLPLHKLAPEIADNSNYLLDKKTGKVLEAARQKYEIADEKNLYLKLDYHFLSEEKYRERLKMQPAFYAPV